MAAASVLLGTRTRTYVKFLKVRARENLEDRKKIYVGISKRDLFLIDRRKLHGRLLDLLDSRKNSIKSLTDPIVKMWVL